MNDWGNSIVAEGVKMFLVLSIKFDNLLNDKIRILKAFCKADGEILLSN